MLCVCAGDRICWAPDRSVFDCLWLLCRMYKNPGLNRQLTFFLLILQVVLVMKTR